MGLGTPIGPRIIPTANSAGWSSFRLKLTAPTSNSRLVTSRGASFLSVGVKSGVLGLFFEELVDIVERIQTLLLYSGAWTDAACGSLSRMITSRSLHLQLMKQIGLTMTKLSGY